ncbi:hypothetical protein EVG20_g10343 [Dentipellis fragilis]|uniref:Uncharacterized protein n=1 Tax=Dentipellis fragilis TaxID=205917 RepID=A0A4Y9XS96_9AGAM|nr:hypothetical protein EVG20_g10343 [Dentipellis fragilis]
MKLITPKSISQHPNGTSCPEDEAGYLDFDLKLADDPFLPSAASAHALQPLFFPTHGHGKGHDALAVLRTWCDVFYCTADENAICPMWEEQRGELMWEQE